MSMISGRVGQAEPVSAMTRAEELFRSSQYQAALELLSHAGSTASVDFLRGKTYLMMGEFKDAGAYLERAASVEPVNSRYQDWLGRAYLRRAELSNPITGTRLKSKARQAFIASLEADRSNVEALNDLFDYYLDTPGFLGGGLDRASDLAERLSALDPVSGDLARTRVASRREDFGPSEQSLRRVIAAAPHEVSHLLTLATSLARQGHTRESDAVFAAATQTAPNSPSVWLARADTLVYENRHLDEARTLLQRYVGASTSRDTSEKEYAARLLRQVGGA